MRLPLNVYSVSSTGFAGIALFLDFHLDADQLCLVRQYINQPCMRNVHKVLIVAPPVIHLLFPQGIFANDEGARAFFDHQVDNSLAGSMQIVVHLPVALVRNALHLLGDAVSFGFGQAEFQFFHAFVIPLISGFKRATVIQARDKALSV